jgi:hypothetical protein
MCRRPLFQMGGGGGGSIYFKNKIKLVGWLTGISFRSSSCAVGTIVESNGKRQIVRIVNGVRKISVKEADLHRILKIFLLRVQRDRYVHIWWCSA